MKRIGLTHEFVEYIPEFLEEGRVYVSIPFATSVHQCFCGCGHEVVTPLSPTDWRMTFDGKTISLYPSIGSWGLPCRSHYWIRHDRVEWASAWAWGKIETQRERERITKQDYYEDTRSAGAHETIKENVPLWRQIKRLWHNLLR